MQGRTKTNVFRSMTVAGLLLGAGAIITTAGAGCSSSSKTVSRSQEVERKTDEAEVARSEFLLADPGLGRFFDEAHAYAIFPNVGKGGAIVGGAYGEGVVYRAGQVVGTVKLTQGTVGLQLGGQAYREVIFFKNDAAFDRFRRDQLELSAQASAVAATAGASANADYENGVAIFTMAKGGLMFEASVGGQKFDYTEGTM